jgi:hypothetical protein
MVLLQPEDQAGAALPEGADEMLGAEVFTPPPRPSPGLSRSFDDIAVHRMQRPFLCIPMKIGVKSEHCGRVCLNRDARLWC